MIAVLFSKIMSLTKKLKKFAAYSTAEVYGDASYGDWYVYNTSVTSEEDIPKVPTDPVDPNYRKIRVFTHTNDAPKKVYAPFLPEYNLRNLTIGPGASFYFAQDSVVIRVQETLRLDGCLISSGTHPDGLYSNLFPNNYTTNEKLKSEEIQILGDRHILPEIGSIETGGHGSGGNIVVYAGNVTSTTASLSDIKRFLVQHSNLDGYPEPGLGGSYMCIIAKNIVIGDGGLFDVSGVPLNQNTAHDITRDGSLYYFNLKEKGL